VSSRHPFRPGHGRAIGVEEVPAATNPFRPLEESHRRVGDLLVEYAFHTSTRAVPEVDTRKRLLGLLAAELEMQSAAEKRVLDPALRELGGDVRRLAEDASRERERIEAILGQLKAIDPVEDAFDGKVSELGWCVRHYAGREEREIFPRLRKKLDPRRLEDIAARLADAGRRPTEARSGAREQTPPRPRRRGR
jgi:hypothetical protein